MKKQLEVKAREVYEGRHQRLIVALKSHIAELQSFIMAGLRFTYEFGTLGTVKRIISVEIMSFEDVHLAPARNQGEKTSNSGSIEVSINLNVKFSLEVEEFIFPSHSSSLLLMIGEESEPYSRLVETVTKIVSKERSVMIEATAMPMGGNFGNFSFTGVKLPWDPRYLPGISAVLE